MGLLDGDIKRAIANGFRGKLLKGTLTKINTTGRAANGDPVTTTTDFKVQGFRESYSAFFRAQSGIPDDDAVFTLIAGLCEAAPVAGDRLNLSGGWWQVRKLLDVDPAGATYGVQCFQVPA